MTVYVLRVVDNDPRRADEPKADRTMDFIFAAGSPAEARRMLRVACPWSGEGVTYWAVVGWKTYP